MESKLNLLAIKVKSERLKKGYTQTKLSELTGLSLRSIQRVEKAEVYPRAYTLKVLSETLNLNLEDIHEKESVEKEKFPGKLILSIGSGLAVLLIGLAYVFQSASFPETDFELILFMLLMVLILSAIQWKIWVK